MGMKFEIGRLVLTAGIAKLFETDQEFASYAMQCFKRFLQGDWGEMDQGDKRDNDEAVLLNNNRIFASYASNKHSEWRIWIITEWDRSVTTILLPAEY